MDYLGALTGKRLELEFIGDTNDKADKKFNVQLFSIINRTNIIIFAPVSEYKLMLASPGDMVRIVFLHETFGLLGFKASVMSCEKYRKIITLHLKILDNIERVQRRNNFRLDITLKASYRIYVESSCNKRQETHTGGHVQAMTKNISGSGACILTDKYLPEGMFIEFFIELDEKTIIGTVSRIVRSIQVTSSKGNLYELGVHFIKISQRDQDSIVRYIFRQQTKTAGNNLNGV